MNQIDNSNLGIYLVIDPSMEEDQLIQALEKAVSAWPCAVQVWDNFRSPGLAPSLICKIKSVCRGVGVPILINNHPEWAELFDLDGVHFDELPTGYSVAIQNLKRLGKLIGVTVNNDLDLIRKVIIEQVDYLSFCSIFPSSTATSCELVDFDVIKKTRELTSIPIFLAGGISTDNIRELEPLNFDGIAVISGVMKAQDPAKAIFNYHQQLKNLKK